MRVLAPLRHPPVALLWAGLSLSAIGDQLYAVALTWVAVGVLGPRAGYLAALQAAAVLAAALGVGRWADRWDRSRSMIGADLARAAVLAAVVAAWLWTGQPSLPQLVAAVLVLAFGQAVFGPALQTVLPALVEDPGLLPAANGLLDATDRSARLLGPGAVALLGGLLPLVHFFTVDAVSFLASAAALAGIRRMRPAAQLALAAPALSTPALPGPIIPASAVPVKVAGLGVGRGWRAMRGHPLLGYVLLTSGPLNGAWYAVFYLALPLLIERRSLGLGGGGGGAAAYGLVLSCYGCTNLLATLVFGGRTLPARPQFQMFGGSLVTAAGLVLMGLAGRLPQGWVLPGLAAAAALSAIGGPMKDIPVAVLRQTRLQRADVAAAMRVSMAAASGGTLLAMLAVPALILLAGVVPVIEGCGALLGAIALVGLVRLASWREEGRGPGPAAHPPGSGPRVGVVARQWRGR